MAWESLGDPGVLASAPGGLSVAVGLLATLAMAVLVAALGHRVKLTEIPAYLIAGALAGPHVLGLVPNPAVVEQISSLAIILLMFTIGLSLDVGSVGRGLANVLGIGAVSTLASLVIGAGLCMVFGLPAAPAVVIGMGISMSSTAVLVKILHQRKELRSPHGRVGVGVSIVQDLLSVLMLAVIPALGRQAAPVDGEGVDRGQMPAQPVSDATVVSEWFERLGSPTAEFLLRGMIGIAGVVVLMLAAKYVLPRILRGVAQVGSGELLIVTSGAIALGFALGTAVLGFSPEMGAFLAGFSLAATPYRFQLTGQLAPMRDLLMAIFFTVVGMKVDPGVLGTSWWLIPLAVAGILVLKSSVIGVVGWLGGMSPPSAVRLGVYLGNAGEFTLVVFSAGVAAGVLSDAAYGSGVLVVTLSLLLSPMLVGPAQRWSDRASRWRMAGLFAGAGLRESEDHPPAAGVAPVLAGTGSEVPGSAQTGAGVRHIVIAGFGPVGRTLAESFDRLRIAYTVIDLNPRTVLRQGTLGRKIVYGDVTNAEVLERAGVATADAVCLTIPDGDAVVRACSAIRRISPSTFIAARTNFLSQALRAKSLGADLVTVEEIATARMMEQEVLERLRRAVRSGGGGTGGAGASGADGGSGASGGSEARGS